MINLFVDGNGSPISINADDCFHIDHVMVLAGDDDYNVNDAVQISGDCNRLTIQTNPLGMPKTLPYRIRGEVAITARIVSEDGKCFDIGLFHHKGKIILKAWENNYSILKSEA